jgi:cytochrome d ubiquinol oxidase subunit I
VSKAVGADQVLGSILIFLLIYALLFAVWVYILDHKIKQGPEEAAAVHPPTGPGGLVGVAGLRSGTGGGSLTGDKGKMP